MLNVIHSGRNSASTFLPSRYPSFIISSNGSGPGSLIVKKNQSRTGWRKEDEQGLPPPRHRPDVVWENIPCFFLFIRKSELEREGCESGALDCCQVITFTRMWTATEHLTSLNLAELWVVL